MSKEKTSIVFTGDIGFDRRGGGPHRRRGRRQPGRVLPRHEPRRHQGAEKHARGHLVRGQQPHHGRGPGGRRQHPEDRPGHGLPHHRRGPQRGGGVGAHLPRRGRRHRHVRRGVYGRVHPRHRHGARHLSLGRHGLHQEAHRRGEGEVPLVRGGFPRRRGVHQHAQPLHPGSVSPLPGAGGGRGGGPPSPRAGELSGPTCTPTWACC